jgi:hypothetical protein
VSAHHVRGWWLLVVPLAAVAAACAGTNVQPTASRQRAVTTTTVAATTTTSGANLPCGGPATVPAAVRVSAAVGLQNPTQYQVQNVTVAPSDPTWARFDTLPVAGQESSYQGGSGIAHCASGAWAVTDFGTTEVGCPGGAVAPPPSAVRSDLGIDCP